MQPESNCCTSDGPWLVNAGVFDSSPIRGNYREYTVWVACINAAGPIAYEVTAEQGFGGWFTVAVCNNCGVLTQTVPSQETIFVSKIQNINLLSFHIKAVRWPNDTEPFNEILFGTLQRSGESNVQLICIGPTPARKQPLVSILKPTDELIQATIQEVTVLPSTLYFHNPHYLKTLQEFSHEDSTCELKVTNITSEPVDFNVSASSEFWKLFTISAKDGILRPAETIQIGVTANNLYMLQAKVKSSLCFVKEDDALYFLFFSRLQSKPADSEADRPQHIAIGMEGLKQEMGIVEQDFPLQQPTYDQNMQAYLNIDYLNMDDYLYCLDKAVPRLTPRSSPVSKPEEQRHFKKHFTTHEQVMTEVEEALLDLTLSSCPPEAQDCTMPMGLHNIGNTCFMNAVLQCLFATYGLVDIFTFQPPNPTLKFVADFKLESKREYHGLMALNFAALVAVFSSKVAASLKPYRFRAAVMKSTGDFEEFVEHDAQEFLGSVIDTLHEDLNTGDPSCTIPEQNNVNLDKAQLGRAAAEAWQMYSNKSWSTIYQLFAGQLVSTMSCLSCGLKSAHFDMFTQVAIEIPDNGQTLTNCLESHFIKEKLSGDGWDCPNCKQKRGATKEINLWRLPDYLIIQLKRFVPDGASFAKNNSPVECPLTLERGDVLGYMHVDSGHRTGLQYALYAVVHHVGGDLQAGHYTATAMHNNCWYILDDHKVSLADPAQYDTHLQGNTAYLLFYRRVNQQHTM